jgi:tRNA(Ile)-lysidine synthase
MRLRRRTFDAGGTAGSALHDAAVHPLVAQTGLEISHRALVNPGETLVLAVSGGRDSMVLLDVLHTLAPSSGTRLVVAHLDHGLRGANSAADARFVGRQASRLGLHFVMEQTDVAALKRSNRLSLEMAARQARHEFLARTARAMDARTVVLGHHRDDQTELFLLRLLRGAGGCGLAGMRWISPSPADRAVRLIRPFLSQTRSALAAYARDRQVPYRRDASNRDLEPLRNRIRQRLLPLLRREYAAAVDNAVWRSMEIVGAEADLASQSAARWLEHPDHAAFEQLHLAVQREAIRSQLWSLGVPADFTLVEELRRFAERPVTAGPALAVTRDISGIVRAIKPAGDRFDPASLELDLTGRAGECVFGELQIHWQRVARRGTPGTRTARHGIEQFDAAKVGNRVLLRHWRPGDRFQPTGMPAPVKLQNLFTNAGIDRARRHQLVVATTASGDLFWVEGLRMAEGFKLDKRSRQRLKWRWHRSGQGGQRQVAPGWAPC